MILLAAALLVLAGPAFAQERGDGQVMGTKEDRVLWVVPNYRTVDRAAKQPRIRPRDKLSIFLKDSLDPFAFPVAGVFAGIAQWNDAPRSWGGGLRGYRNRYFAALADQTDSNLMAEALFPILLRQDPRYLRLAKGPFWRRAGYALSRVVITRKDSGGQTLNWSELGGNAAMVAISNAYYPPEDRNAGAAGAKLGIQVGVDAVGNLGKEFWPDLRRWLLGH